MSSPKPALKPRRDALQAPAHLLLQNPFEFFTSLPMQECIVRLKFATKEEVYLNRISPTKIEFNFVQRGSKFGEMWAVGYIEELDDTRTRIFGKTGLPHYELILSLLVFAGVYVLFVLNNLSALVGTCFALVILTPIFIVVASLNYDWGRDKLTEKLRSIDSPDTSE
jgi:hypothetical protein